MRKVLRTSILALAFAAIGLAFGFAQTASTPFPTPAFYASAFNLWSINGQNANTYTFPGRSVCNSSAQNQNFFVFATNAPVFIQDSNSANNEIVTPSAVINTAGSCGVTISPSHSHYTFQMKSGTGGLQEAINAVKASGGVPALVIVDRNWYSNALALAPYSSETPVAMIQAAAGGYGVLIEDITVSPSLFYKWNGTAYSSTNSNWTNAAPTAAAGAAAGSGPTIANTKSSTQLSGVVNLTTGTTTTTGTIFTETSPATGSGGFNNSGTCTVTQISGPTVGFTVATSGSTTRVCTVTVSTPALVDSTDYSFAYKNE